MFKILVHYRQMEINSTESTAQWKDLIFELSACPTELKRFGSKGEAERFLASFITGCTQKGWHYHDGEYILNTNITGTKIEPV